MMSPEFAKRERERQRKKTALYRSTGRVTGSGDSAAKSAWINRNPIARRAHHAVSNAVRDGKLKSQSCEVCGSGTVHAHHEDYSKPLEVRWLCPAHHAATHVESREVAA